MNPYRDRGFKRPEEQARARAFLRDMNANGLTWAETAQGATLDVRSVSRILGHARTATTERYLSRFDRAMIKGVFDRIEASLPKPKEP